MQANISLSSLVNSISYPLKYQGHFLKLYETFVNFLLKIEKNKWKFD